MSSENEVLKRLDEIQGAIKSLTDDFGKHKENMEHFKADFEAHKENMEKFKDEFKDEATKEAEARVAKNYPPLEKIGS